MRGVRYIWHWLRRKLNLGWLLLCFHPNSVVVIEGWNYSFRTNQSVDRKGLPVPWCTYPFIYFIRSRLNKDLRIFEYGCGNSTIFYAHHVREIIAVENDNMWAQQVMQRLPVNGKIIFHQQERDYVAAVSNYGLFDIVIIDGLIDRLACTEFAVKALTTGGVIILDNSNWVEFAPCVHFLYSHGFRELPFYGQTPITFVPSQTSVFYRTSNCLGI